MTKLVGPAAPVLTNWYALYLPWVPCALYGGVVAETRNAALAAWMTDHQMSPEELAGAVNDAVGDLTGRVGSTSERTVFRWLAGEVRWPQERQRRGLEAVTGLGATCLGFVPRRKSPPAPAPSEDDVLRRQLLGAAAGTAVAALSPAPPAAARPQRVGTCDVIRLREDVGRLVALGADRGGHGTLARDALAGAAEALGLQGKSATQRVRQRLYALAAEFTATAAWALIDAGLLDDADQHLDRALALAGLAQDTEMAMQSWNLRAMLARQRKRYPEAVAAAQAAQTTTVARHSPLHASLAHARTAVGLAHSGDRRAALRCLGRAEDAMSKADPARPRSWIAFYGPAELYSLTAIVRDVVGDWAEAEAAAHRALAALPASYRRNRAHTTARLALAQLHQDDFEQACATSGSVFTIMDGVSLPGRARQLLGDFQRDLIARAPSAHIAHAWMDRYRSEWSPS
ncbi:XRE family transcriptional regulator [Streptomyces sp. NPDC087532]|uniref:XRE family transcriptional regulator n=1 Tax=Streptomyces sp. NPDC087532 TaxID=3365795 RepID=UPI0038045A63